MDKLFCARVLGRVVINLLSARAEAEGQGRGRARMMLVYEEIFGRRRKGGRLK